MQFTKTYSLLSSRLIHVLLGLGVLIASSKISIPIGPVPLTMQTCAIGLAGALLGARLGSITVGLYLLGGLIGMPVFATTLVGPAAFLGPTGGYLISFLPAVWFAGYCKEKGFNNSVALTLFSQLFINLFIIIFGALWLSCLIGEVKAFWLGCVPFLVGGVLKSLLACALITLVRIGDRR